MSRFKEFYQANRETYNAQIVHMNELVNLSQIHEWLEQSFKARFDSYQIFISPLMRGNHTASIKHGNDFHLFLAAVSGPQLGRNRADGTGDLLVLRQVFTEVDHGYVDQRSVELIDELKSTFKRPSVWYGNDGGFYSTPFAFFNEYMTWGTMLLYIKDKYPEKIYLEERNKTVKYMEEGRKFIVFGEFMKSLENLYQERSGDETLSDLFLPIFKWAKKFENSY